jgi:hypothetical protein
MSLGLAGSRAAWVGARDLNTAGLVLVEAEAWAGFWRCLRCCPRCCCFCCCGCFCCGPRFDCARAEDEEPDEVTEKAWDNAWPTDSALPEWAFPFLAEGGFDFWTLLPPLLLAMDRPVSSPLEWLPRREAPPLGRRPVLRLGLAERRAIFLVTWERREKAERVQRVNSLNLNSGDFFLFLRQTPTTSAAVRCSLVPSYRGHYYSFTSSCSLTITTTTTRVKRGRGERSSSMNLRRHSLPCQRSSDRQWVERLSRLRHPGAS